MAKTHNYWLRLSLTIAILSLLVQFLEFHGVFANLEGSVLDFFLSRQSPKTVSVVVLQIDDGAHETCFQSRSPLDPDRLESIVRDVMSTGPGVLGIDIFTDRQRIGPAYQRLTDLTRTSGKIVWASAPESSDPRRTWFFPWLVEGSEPFIVHPSQILGQDPDLMPEGSWGVSGNLRDEDLRLRRFIRGPAMSSDPNDPASVTQGKSLTRQIAEKYCVQNECNLDRSTLDEVLVSFGGRVRSFDLSDLLDCSSIQPTGRLWQEFAGAAKGSVVLIGGSYRSSNDFHDTPLGRLPGVLIIAHAVDSEIRGAGVTDTPRYVLMLFDMFVGGVLVLIFEEMRDTRRSIEMSIVLIAVLVVASGLGVSRGRIWFTWIGVAAGVLIHLLWEVYHASKTWHETATAPKREA